MKTETATRIPAPCRWHRPAWLALRAGLRRAAMRMGVAIAGVAALSASAHGQTILDAGYDPATDALVVEVAYRGTHPNHVFRLEWGPCEKSPEGRQTTVVRLIDTNGDDLAQRDYQVVQRFDLASLACRPAEVTVRSGPVSNRTVSVPAKGR